MWAPDLYWGEDKSSAGIRTPDRPTSSNVPYLVTCTGQDTSYLFNKDKTVPLRAVKAYSGRRGKAPLILYLTVGRGDGLASRPGRFRRGIELKWKVYGRCSLCVTNQDGREIVVRFSAWEFFSHLRIKRSILKKLS